MSYWPAFPFRFEVLSNPIKEFDRQVRLAMEKPGAEQVPPVGLLSTRAPAISSVRRQNPALHREYLLATQPTQETRPRVEDWFTEHYAKVAHTWQPGYLDEALGYYIPTDDDFQIVHTAYPQMDETKPEWRRIFRDLLKAGHNSGDLKELTTPLIVELLQADQPTDNDPPYLGIGFDEDNLSAHRDGYDTAGFGRRVKPWKLFRLLVRAGEGGLSFQDLQSQMGMAEKTEDGLRGHKGKVNEVVAPLRIEIDADGYGIWRIKPLPDPA